MASRLDKKVIRDGVKVVTLTDIKATTAEKVAKEIDDGVRLIILIGKELFELKRVEIK